MGALARSRLWDAERRCTAAPSRVQVIRSGRDGSVLARQGTYPAILNHALPNRPPVPRRDQGNAGIFREMRGYQAAISRSTLSSIHLRDRWRNASVKRASAVSTSNNVRGPVTTGNAALSTRAPRTSRTRTRRPPRVTSRGRPSNQSARTRTSTGSTLTIAISRLLSGALNEVMVTGHWCRERLFGFDWSLVRTGVRCQALLSRRRHPRLGAWQVGCHAVSAAARYRQPRPRHARRVARPRFRDHVRTARAGPCEIGRA